MARPKDQPLQREGRWTYMKFMGAPICFPSETATDQDIGVMRAINAGCAKNLDTEITDAQHVSLQRLLNHQAIFIGGY